MLVHTYNPNFLGDRGRRNMDGDQPGQRLLETLCEKQTKNRGTGV
jgi:hypothetical protein